VPVEDHTCESLGETGVSVEQLITAHLDIWTAADTEKKSGRGRSSGSAGSVYGVKKLRELILELAVRGKLVPQDASDEPASELLKRIATEKAKLIAEGKIKKSKPLAEITDDEKPFELPINWKWAKLGIIGYTQTGATPSKSISEYFGSDIPFIKPGDIYPNYIEYSNEGLSFYGAEKSGRIATSNSLLMVCIGTIGKCNLVQTDCSFNQQINSVTPYIFNSNFLLAVCRSVYFNAEAWDRSSSTTIAILNKGNWEEICIPIPPLAEQHRIVAKVDELMTLCDQLENQHNNAAEAHEKLVTHLLGTLTKSQNAEDFNTSWQRISEHFDTLFTTEASIDALKQTLLQLAVMGKLVPQDPNDEPASELLKRIQAEKAKLIAEGKIKKDKSLPSITDDEKPFELPKNWECVRFQEVFDVRDGTHDTPKYCDSGFPLITSKNLYSGILDFSNIRYISEEDHYKIKERSGVDRGDILFAMIGSIGNPVIVETDNDFSIKNVALFKPYSHQLCEMYYLLKYLLKASVDMREQASGAVQSFISLGVMRNYVFYMPPLAEQHRIVAKVDELMAICDQLKAGITSANQLQQKLADIVIEQAIL
jgi:type I restriction enzyme S subunit